MFIAGYTTIAVTQTGLEPGASQPENMWHGTTFQIYLAYMQMNSPTYTLS